MNGGAGGLDRRSLSLAGDSPRGGTVATVVLLGAGAGYGGGNVGPVTGAIAGRFGVSLSAVGLTMTVFFATITAVTIGSAQILRRLFVLFAVTAAVREFSGQLAVGSPDAQRLAAAGPLLTAAGLAGLAVDTGVLPSVRTSCRWP
jgi:hypothetical protein